MRPFRLFMLIFCLFCSFAAPALARDETMAEPAPEDASSPEDLIYITEDFPPYNFLHNGQLTGYAVDILHLMWREMDVVPQNITVMPWDRGMRELENRPNVVLFNAVKSSDRARRFQFVTPTNTIRMGIVAARERHFSVGSVADLLPYRVGSLNSDISEEAVVGAGFPLERLQRVTSMPLNAQMLAQGRLDMVVCDPYSFADMLEQIGEDPDDYETIIDLGLGECGFMFSQEVPQELVQRFQTALDIVRQSQEFLLLGKKYLGL